ncbi:MAG: hypothetical protein ACOX8E_08975 [Ruminococcus sp.]
MREKFRRFMMGRYGVDDLGKVTLYVSLALLILSLFLRYNILYILAIVLLAVCYFRMFSKNYSKRYEENQKFLTLKTKVLGRFTAARRHRADREHCYFKCPSCRQTVRVPRGKGKISISCPKCGTQFIKRT